MNYNEKNLFERVLVRQTEMESDRQPLEADYDRIIDHFRPDLVRFKDYDGKIPRGILGANIYEGTGPWAMRLMSDGMQGNLVSSSIVWLRYAVGDKKYKGNDALNKWLQEFEECMLSSYSDENSNFYSAMGAFTRHGITTGSPVILPELDPVSGRIIDIIPHPATRYLMQNRFGIPNGLHIKSKWTIRNAVDTFGLDKMSAQTRRNWENGNDKEKITIIRAIYFFRDRIFKDLPGSAKTEGVTVLEDNKENTYKTFNPRWPWVSIYCEEGCSLPDEKKPLRVEGYFSKPFMVWHYEKDPSEIYSRTPAWFSFYDVKSANQIRKSIMMASQRSVDTAWWVPDYLKNKFKAYPHGVNWYSVSQADHKPEQLYEKVDYPFGFEVEDRFTDGVKRHFFTEMWEMLSVWSREQKAPPTATQIINMVGEKAVLLGPRVGPFLRTLNEIDSRHVDIEQSRGNLPEPPDEVIEILEEAGGRINPEFVGPLYQAQKQYLSTRGIEAFLATAERVFAMEPMSKHKIKWPDLVEYLAEEGKFPQDLINSQEEYDEILDAIAQQAMQDKMIEMGTDVAKAIPSVSKDVEPNSPIAGLLEGAA